MGVDPFKPIDARLLPDDVGIGDRPINIDKTTLSRF